MKPDLLIKDVDYEKALDEMGFCVVPLFTHDQIAGIKALYEQFSIDNNVSGLIASHSKIGGDRNCELSNALKELLMPALAKSFSDFDFFMGGFMVKEANNSTELHLHQDWNIVDESHYTSYQIWIPLDLSHPANGGMFVLPGSHHFYHNYRSGSYGIPDIVTDDSLRPYVVDMVIPPGEALVFHNSLFHASYPNTSNHNRISAIISIYKKTAPLIYCHKDPKHNCTEIYGITSEIFLTSLSTLENAGVPEPALSKEIAPIDTTDNRRINSLDLLEKYKGAFGQELDFEPRQLHILKNKEIQKGMDQYGYVVLDLVDQDQVKFLKAEYHSKFKAPETTIGRSTSMEHSTLDFRRFIHKFIIDRVQSRLDQYLENYQIPIASYFIKYAHSAGDLLWNQDASLMINTHLEPHYGIWCPLMDVNESNGAFCLIEGSHKFSHSIYLEAINWPFFDYSSEFNSIKKVLNLKAGQMVLFDMRLIHNATANDSDKDRVVFCMRLTHKKSKYYSFSCEDMDNQIVSVYRQGPGIYLGDEWSGQNQVVNRNNKVGEMSNIYFNINFNAISKRLKKTTLVGLDL